MARLRPPKFGWRFWRRASQAAFLLTFLWLFRQTELRADEVPAYTNLAFRLDPLAALAAMITGRVVIVAMLLSLVTVGLTLLFGRAFCGWICPMGTLLDWLGTPIRFRARRGNERFRSLRTVRYWLLIGVLSAAVLGFPLVGLFDPFSILHQGLTVVVDPILSSSSYAAFDWLYQNSPETVTSVSEPTYTFLLDHALAQQPAVFVGAWVSAAVLLTILLLERAQRRFWCRYLCPLGALLGLIARMTPFGRRPAKACGGCRECEKACRMDAFDDQRRLQPQACTVCMDCVSDCPNGIAHFFWFPPRSVEGPGEGDPGATRGLSPRFHRRVRRRRGAARDSRRRQDNRRRLGGRDRSSPARRLDG
jgi:polyferredoxin